MSDEQMQSQVLNEQMRMFLLNTPSVSFFASLFALLLAIYISAHTTEQPLLLAWLVAKIFLSLTRFLHAYILRKKEEWSSIKQKNTVLVLASFDGVAWGLIAPLTLSSIDQQAGTVLGCSLICIVAVATFTSHVLPSAMLAYCTPILTIAAAAYLHQGTEFGIFMATGMSVFLISAISVGKRAGTNLTEMLWRRLTMDRILRDKEEALLEATRQDTIKSQFVATMSHELRTPLHGILGLARMLQQKPLNNGILQNIHTIEKSGEHLLSLINNVLDFSKIEAGHLQLNNRDFNALELINETIEITRFSSNEKQLPLELEIDIPKNINIIGDAQKIKQIIINLISNAIKFTTSGHISIFANYNKKNKLLTFKVRDTGIGISLKDLPSIFEPYKQAKNVAGGISGGTGLGLTIAREISRSMSGDIICTSEEGVGSEFVFTATLPFVLASNQFTDSTSQKQPSHWLSTTQSTNRKLILLAEDNEVNALIAKLMLEKFHCKVEHVRDGMEVLERLRNTELNRPDLVLMDCQMPRINGFEATLKIREFERINSWPRIPVIALTASTTIEDGMRSIESGMDSHLSKPFTEFQLISSIEKFI